MSNQHGENAQLPRGSERIVKLGEEVTGTRDGLRLVEHSYRIPLSRLVQVGEPEITESRLEVTTFQIDIEPGDDPIDFKK
jgi:hypothetical protein